MRPAETALDARVGIQSGQSGDLLSAHRVPEISRSQEWDRRDVPVTFNIQSLYLNPNGNLCQI